MTDFKILSQSDGHLDDYSKFTQLTTHMFSYVDFGVESGNQLENAKFSSEYTFLVFY